MLRVLRLPFCSNVNDKNIQLKCYSTSFHCHKKRKLRHICNIWGSFTVVSAHAKAFIRYFPVLGC